MYFMFQQLFSVGLSSVSAGTHADCCCRLLCASQVGCCAIMSMHNQNLGEFEEHVQKRANLHKLVSGDGFQVSGFVLCLIVITECRRTCWFFMQAAVCIFGWLLLNYGSHHLHHQGSFLAHYWGEIAKIFAKKKFSGSIFFWVFFCIFGSKTLVNNVFGVFWGGKFFMLFAKGGLFFWLSEKKHG